MNLTVRDVRKFIPNPLTAQSWLKREIERCDYALNAKARRGRAFASFLKGIRMLIDIDTLPRLNSKTEVLEACTKEVRVALVTALQRLHKGLSPIPANGFKSVQLMVFTLGEMLTIYARHLKYETYQLQCEINPNLHDRSHNTYLHKWLALACSWAYKWQMEMSNFARDWKISDPNDYVKHKFGERFTTPTREEANSFPHIPGISDLRFVRSRLEKPICSYSDLQGFHVPVNKVFWLDEVFPQCCNDGYSFLPDLDHIRKRFSF